jgi:hypothetical protein
MVIPTVPIRVRVLAIAGLAGGWCIGLLGQRAIVEETGYLLLVLAYADRFVGQDGGETWFSLLLESWFWIGLPLLASAVLGAGGWLGAAALDRRLRRGHRGHAHA